MKRRENILIITRRLIILSGISLLVMISFFGLTLWLSQKFMVSWVCFMAGIMGGFVSIQQRLKKTGFEDMFASGIVLTGGVALMEGVQEAAERFLGLPIRRGTPRNIGGLMDVVNSPIYATGVGLVLYGAENQQEAPRKFRTGGALSSSELCPMPIV